MKRKQCKERKKNSKSEAGLNVVGFIGNPCHIHQHLSRIVFLSHLDQVIFQHFRCAVRKKTIYSEMLLSAFTTLFLVALSSVCMFMLYLTTLMNEDLLRDSQIIAMRYHLININDKRCMIFTMNHAYVFLFRPFLINC